MMKERLIQRVCPKCKETYVGYPALSRVDNVTLICPECGVREALESIGVNDKAEQDRIVKVSREGARRA